MKIKAKDQMEDCASKHDKHNDISLKAAVNADTLASNSSSHGPSMSEIHLESTSERKFLLSRDRPTNI